MKLIRLSILSILILALASQASAQTLGERAANAFRDPRVIGGMTTLQVASLADAKTSQDLIAQGGRERNPFLRTPDGSFRTVRHQLVWGGLNASLLAVDLHKDRRARWVSFAIRIGLAVMLFKQAARNHSLLR